VKTAGFNETEIKQIVAISVLSGHKMHQIRFRPGLCPGPRWRSSRRSPRPPSRLGRGIPPPHSPPLGAYGAWIFTPSAPRFQRSATSFFTV